MSATKEQIEAAAKAYASARDEGGHSVASAIEIALNAALSLSPPATKDHIEAAAKAMAEMDHIASLCAIPDWDGLSEGRRDMLRRHAEAALSLPTDRGMDAETIQTLLDLLNPLHGSLDRQTYDEKMKVNFDSNPDDEYSVDVTSRQERDLTLAVFILEDRKRQASAIRALSRSPTKPDKHETEEGK